MSAEDKIDLSLVLDFLILSYDRIKAICQRKPLKNIEHLQEQELLTCLRNQMNISGDRTQ